MDNAKISNVCSSIIIEFLEKELKRKLTDLEKTGVRALDFKTARKDILFYANNCEIIGSVCSNPELLEVGE